MGETVLSSVWSSSIRMVSHWWIVLCPHSPNSMQLIQEMGRIVNPGGSMESEDVSEAKKDQSIAFQVLFSWFLNDTRPKLPRAEHNNYETNPSEGEGWIFISVPQIFPSAIRLSKTSSEVALDPTCLWVPSSSIPFTEARRETFAVPPYPHSPSPTRVRLFVRAVLLDHRAQCLFYNKACGQSEGMQPWWRAMPARASLSGPGV